MSAKERRFNSARCAKVEQVRLQSDAPGHVCAIGDQSIDVAAQGGRLELRTVRLEARAKMAAGALAAAMRIEVGNPLES